MCRTGAAPVPISVIIVGHRGGASGAPGARARAGPAVYGRTSASR